MVLAGLVDCRCLFSPVITRPGSVVVVEVVVVLAGLVDCRCCSGEVVVLAGLVDCRCLFSPVITRPGSVVVEVVVLVAGLVVCLGAAVGLKRRRNWFVLRRRLL